MSRHGTKESQCEVGTFFPMSNKTLMPLCYLYHKNVNNVNSGFIITECFVGHIYIESFHAFKF